MKNWLVVLVGLLLVDAACGEPLNSFDEIAYWVGSGSNRAALAIDWRGDSATDESLVWGYRWDGSATGETMLRDVVAADERLFAKLGSHSLGLTTFGLGYDLDDDGAFAITDGSLFDATGVTLGTKSTADGAVALGSGDLYEEGWEDAYWHYSVGASSEGGPVWGTSGYGPTNVPLVDGTWHGFAIAVTLNANEFPQNRVGAAPPPLPGDFNADGAVDAADYTTWRDADGPPESYALWVAAYHPTGGGPLSVPEPTTSGLLFTLLLLLFPPTEKRA